MAWFPGAIRKEITRHRTAIIGPRRYTLHTAVSSGSSLFSFFNVAGRATSHFYVRADGTVEQYVDTRFRAPAQLEGNHDTISVETQDMGGPFPKWSGSNVPAWTDAQVESLARIGAWLHEVDGIKLQLCPSSRPRSEGFAYHRQGIDPWRVSGGERWSSAAGKVCPGDRRVAQVRTVLERARQIAGRTVEDDVELTDKVNFKKKDGTRYWAGKILDVDGFSVGGLLGYAGASLFYLRDTVMPTLAAIRAEGKARDALIKGLAAQESVELSDEQVAVLAAAVRDAGQGAAEEVLKKLRAAGEALTDDDPA